MGLAVHQGYAYREFYFQHFQRPPAHRGWHLAGFDAVKDMFPASSLSGVQLLVLVIVISTYTTYPPEMKFLTMTLVPYGDHFVILSSTAWFDVNIALTRGRHVPQRVTEGDAGWLGSLTQAINLTP